MTSFAIISQATDPTLTQAILDQIAYACDVQCNRDLAPYYGGNYRVRACTPDNPPVDGEIVALITDDLPNAPGAVAYHTWSGVPEIYVARNMVTSLLVGRGSLSQAMGHEICETIGDPAINLWADDGLGTEWAYELCDAVESTYYEIDGIAGPDFLLPSFWEPAGRPPYSFVQAQGGTGPSAPFQTADGGYQISRPPNPFMPQTSSSSLLRGASVAGPIAHLSLEQIARKRHPCSRTYRRGVR